MIISRTPYRISLFGGGTDYPVWYRENGGAVLGMAINKYCHIFLRYLPPYFAHRYRIVYSRTELTTAIEEIGHPSVRAVLAWSLLREGVEVQHSGDVPARSGLGTSSAFTVGLLNAVLALKGKAMDAEELGALATHLEQNVIGESVGSQDQAWAAHGGLNRIDFHQDGRLDVHPLALGEARKQALVDHMMLVYTGNARNGAEIAQKKIDNVARNNATLRAMREIVEEGERILLSPETPIAELGLLLEESWRLKQALAKEVCTSDLDDIHAAAMGAGALGGKVLGAGGGGFMLFLVKPEHRAALRTRLRGLTIVDIGIDYSGSQVIYSDERSL